MSKDNNPLFHLEPVAVAILEKHYEGREPPAKFPANEENALVGYSIAISLKRIADCLEEKNS
jgi:hypothetical protein